MSLAANLRLGLRFLTRAPGYYALSIVTLALGIGIATLMFSVTESVLWRPLPLPHPDRLVLLYNRQLVNPANNTGSSSADFLDWRARAQSFSAIGALRSADPHTLTGIGERVRSEAVSAGFFALLGVQPMLGREFTEENSAVHDVVLTNDFWRAHFSADPAAVGRILELDRQPFTVIGVLPPAFRLAAITGIPDPAFFVPIDFTGAMAQRSTRFTTVIARLRAHVSIEAAAAEMHSLARQIAAGNPANAGWDARVEDFRESFTKYNRTLLYLFFAFSILVLAIASANAGGLALVRSVGRRREYALRLVLGAGRVGLIHQALAESFWIALPSSLAGLLLASFGVDAVRHMMPPGFLVRDDVLSVDWPSATFVLALSLAIAAIAAIVPAVHLIAAEMTLSFILLFAAGLFLSSNARLAQVDLGFDPHNLFTANIIVGGSHSTPAAQALLFSEVMRRAQPIPGIRQIALASVPPLGGGEWIRYRIAGRAYPHPDSEPDSLVRVITPGYFQSIGARVLLGRAFTDLDSTASPRIAIVNENLARSAFSGEIPVGKTIFIDSSDPSIPSGPVQIVGFAANTHELGLSEVPFEDVFLPLAQNPRRAASLIVKYDGASAPIAATLRSELERLDPDAAIYAITSMEESIDRNFVGVRFRMAIVCLFAALAVLLAGVGIYGAIAFSVAQRTREFALRLALGAIPSDIRRIAVARTARLTLLAAVAGIAISLAIGRLLGSALYLVPHQHTGVLFGVGMHDPLSMAAASAILAATALAASLLPASRAAKVHLADELRNDC
jgi:putative ABC transport system permease protein